MVFVAAGLVALAVIAFGTVLASRQVAEADALNGAEHTADRTATYVVRPLLGAALNGDTTSRAELDREVRSRLEEGSIIEMVVWRSDGTVVYAGRSADIGRVIDLPDEARAAIERGERSTGFEAQPETGPIDGVTRVVEAYVPLALPGQPPMSLEVYYDYARVDHQISDLHARIVPLAVIALLALQLVQVPIAASLARSVRRHVADRAALLERALSASDAERRTIAADLHDGAVQDLNGVVFALTAMQPSIDPAVRPVAQHAVRTLGGAADSLRRLMIDIYPPDLSGPGLPEAVNELAEPLRRGGTTVVLDVERLPPMDRDIAAALYRVARETLLNVAKHAHAHNVLVQLRPDPERPGVLLRVVDDGVGAPPDAIDRRPHGHFGLRLLADRVADLGGELTVTASEAGGTVAAARLPAQ
jgi:signal transduction histidine kinase